MKKYDLIIIGAGPAGLSAAIYARRGNISVLLIEKNMDGGKLSKISDIDNYPGIKHISGFELYMNMLEHAKSYNPDIIEGKVIKVVDNTVILENKEEYEFKALLIATGTSQRKLDIENANKYIGKGISYCATCDGFFFRNKEVTVIAENTNALTEILYLSNIVKKINIITSRDDLIGEQQLIDTIKKLNNVEIYYQYKADSLIINDEKITGLKIKNIYNNDQLDISSVAIFPYISNNPSTDFIDIEFLDDKGFIKVNQDKSTIKENIFAAGDCTNSSLKQVVCACNDGAICATNIIKLLKTNK